MILWKCFWSDFFVNIIKIQWISVLFWTPLTIIKWTNTVKTFFKISFLCVCSAEERYGMSYRFGMSWEWVNANRNYISGWAIHLSCEVGLNFCTSPVFLLRTLVFLGTLLLWTPAQLYHRSLLSYGCLWRGVSFLPSPWQPLPWR